MKAIKYVLFDWDGCLARTLDLWMDSYKKVFEQYALFPSEEEIVKKVFGDWEGPKKFGIEDAKIFMKKVVDDIEESYASIQLYPNAEDVVMGLNKRNLKLALVTSSLKSTVNKKLKKIKLSSIFDAFLGRDDVKRDKPDPEMIISALRKMGGLKNQSAIVGDNWKDIRAGKAAGITTVLYYPSQNHKFYKKGDLLKEKADYFIEDHKDLLKIIT